MKPKFEEFNNGLVGIYRENDEEELERVFAHDFRFGNENVSAMRHYAARAADENIDRIIHIPLPCGRVETDCYAVIGGGQYHIEKVDICQKTLPPVLKLTLKRIKKQRKKVADDGAGQQA